jgi:hypothetical protein
MMSARPFETDQAAGLRQLFANQPKCVIAGFICTNRTEQTPSVIRDIAIEISKLGLQCALVDEQPADTSNTTLSKLADSGTIKTISRPQGAGRDSDWDITQSTDYILVDAYPSITSAIHKADVLIIVEQAPLKSGETIRKITRATKRLANKTTLLLTHAEDKKAALSTRLDIERISEEETGKKIHWLGAISTKHSGTEMPASSVAKKLTLWGDNAAAEQ